MNDRHVLSIELDGGLNTLKIATLLTLIPIIFGLLLHSGTGADLGGGDGGDASPPPAQK